MSRSVWLHRVAVRGCLIAGVVLLVAARPCQAAEDGYQPEPQPEAQTSEPAATPVAPPNKPAHPYPPECPDGDSNCRDWEDLKAQWRMAEAAERQFEYVKTQNELIDTQNLIVGIEAGLLLLTLIAAVYAAIKARQSAEAAEEHVVRLERPYITMRINKDTLIPSVDDMVAVDVGNIGRIFGIIGTPMLQMFIAKKRPDPMHVDTSHYTFGSIVEPDKAVTFFVTRDLIIGDPANIGRGDHTAYLLATIPYVHGKRQYETGVCLRYDPTLRVWGYDGGASHNYMT